MDQYFDDYFQVLKPFRDIKCFEDKNYNLSETILKIFF